jgi:hypothetical protein
MAERRGDVEAEGRNGNGGRVAGHEREGPDEVMRGVEGNKFERWSALSPTRIRAH